MPLNKGCFGRFKGYFLCLGNVGAQPEGFCFRGWKSPQGLYRGIILKPQPPHLRQKHEQRYSPQNCRICLVLKHLGSYFVQIFVQICLPCMWGAGVTSVLLIYNRSKVFGSSPLRFQGNSILCQVKKTMEVVINDIKCRTVSHLDGQIANRESQAFSECGQRSQAIPQFHVEQMLNE